MTDLIFRSDMSVSLIRHCADDDSVGQAARISTKTDQIDGLESAGLINFLMSNRHGTPFEHNSMTFRIEAPIFVFREFHRHRIGWSYNEMSGRYTELPPTFYVPDGERNLTQIGKAGAYTFVPGTESQQYDVAMCTRELPEQAYQAYQFMLNAGIAKEVARIVLPVGLYSAMYATCNARSLMAFLSLRTKHEDSKFPSYPQREIEMVAEQMEAIWAELMPLTHASFHKNGRVAP